MIPKTSFIVFLLILTLGCLLADTAPAQRAKGRTADLATIMDQRLDLSPSQTKAIRELAGAHQKARAEWDRHNRTKAKKFRAAGKRAEYNRLRHGRFNLERTFVRPILRVLTPEQRVTWISYNMIMDQRSRLSGVGLTEPQVRQLQTACQKSAQDMVGRGGRIAIQDQGPRNRQVLGELEHYLAKNVLTPNQRAGARSSAFGDRGESTRRGRRPGGGAMDEGEDDEYGEDLDPNTDTWEQQRTLDPEDSRGSGTGGADPMISTGGKRKGGRSGDFGRNTGTVAEDHDSDDDVPDDYDIDTWEQERTDDTESGRGGHGTGGADPMISTGGGRKGGRSDEFGRGPVVMSPQVWIVGALPASHDYAQWQTRFAGQYTQANNTLHFSIQNIVTKVRQPGPGQAPGR